MLNQLRGYLQPNNMHALNGCEILKSWSCCSFNVIMHSFNEHWGRLHACMCFIKRAAQLSDSIHFMLRMYMLAHQSSAQR
jgi:hypothetical protein